MDTCHLPLQGWSQWPLQSLTSAYPETSLRLRAKMRYSILWEKLEEQISDRYFRKILWALFPVSYTWKSTKIMNNDICSSWPAATFCQKALFHGPPSPKITYSLTSTPLLGGVSSEMSEMLAAWLKSSFCTQIKLNSQFSGYAFFFFFSWHIRSLILCKISLPSSRYIERIYQNCINTVHL